MTPQFARDDLVWLYSDRGTLQSIAIQALVVGQKGATVMVRHLQPNGEIFDHKFSYHATALYRTKHDLLMAASSLPEDSRYALRRIEISNQEEQVTHAQARLAHLRDAWSKFEREVQDARARAAFVEEIRREVRDSGAYPTLDNPTLNASAAPRAPDRTTYAPLNANRVQGIFDPRTPPEE